VNEEKVNTRLDKGTCLMLPTVSASHSDPSP
jgi:hypothetical protein